MRILAFAAVGTMVLIDMIGVIYLLLNKEQAGKGLVYLMMWIAFTIFWILRVRDWVREGRF